MSIPPAVPPATPWPTAPPGEEAMRVGFPEVREPAPQGHRLSHVTMVALLLAGLALLTGILVVVAVFAPAPPPAPCPPLRCQAPPIGDMGAASSEGTQASSQGRLYRNPQGFTVRYYPFPGTTTYPGVSTNASSITFSFPFKASYGGTSYLTVIGQPDGGATPQQIVNDAISAVAPNAQVQFLMPQAYVGYWPGYGEAFETQVASADGSNATYELIVMAAVHNGFGIAVVASGQLLRQVTPGSSFWDGHPSPAAINVAYVADSTVNGIAFPGAPSP